MLALSNGKSSVSRNRIVSPEAAVPKPCFYFTGPTTKQAIAKGGLRWFSHVRASKRFNR
jgi:hypothetical protein